LLLLYLFNVCVTLTYYPRIFKKVNIIIIKKLRKKNYINPKTYRPIILLKIIKKIIKLILAKRINNLIKKYYFLLIEQINTKQNRFIKTALELLVK